MSNDNEVVEQPIQTVKLDWDEIKEKSQRQLQEFLFWSAKEKDPNQLQGPVIRNLERFNHELILLKRTFYPSIIGWIENFFDDQNINIEVILSSFDTWNYIISYNDEKFEKIVGVPPYKTRVEAQVAAYVNAFETLELPEEELKSGVDFTKEEKKEIMKDAEDAFERMKKRNEESDRFITERDEE